MGFLETFVNAIGREVAHAIANDLTQKEIERLRRPDNSKDPELLELERQLGIELVSIDRLSFQESYEAGYKALRISRKQLDRKIFGDPESELQEASIMVTVLQNSVREYIVQGKRYGLNDNRLIESRIAILNKLLRLIQENLRLNSTQTTRLQYIRKRLDDSKRELLTFLDKEYY